MKCSDCIVWEGRRCSLVYGRDSTLAFCAGHGWKEIYGEMAEYYGDKLREHALLSGEHESWCRIFDKQVIVG